MSFLEKHTKLSFFRKLILFINYIACFCLGLSYLACFISPDIFWPLALFGITYPAWLIINILFAIFWMWKRKMYFIFSVIFILAGYWQLPQTIQLNSKGNPTNTVNKIKALSFNVKIFDLYNYNKDWSHNFSKRNEIFQFLRKENPDILCLQEFVFDRSGSFVTLDSILAIDPPTYYHVKYTKSSRNINFFGIITFSKYPIIRRGTVDFESHDGNVCIYSDLKINNDTIRVYNAHLASIRFKKDQHRLAEKITNLENIRDKKNLSIVKRIVDQLKVASIKRAFQSEIVAKHMSSCSYPFIFCGDLNAPPSSYAYKQITKELSDAFVESGRGLGQSYIGAFPSLRIDYIMHTRNLSSSSFVTHKVELSDHRPVSCYFEIIKDL